MGTLIPLIDPRHGFYERARDRDRARLAMHRGDIEDARRLLGPFSEVWGGEFPREICFIVEARARFRMLSDGWIPSDSDIARMLRLHRRCRRFAVHDRFVRLLVEALEARGERGRAATLVHGYVLEYRRERGPLPIDLCDLLHKLSISIPGRLGSPSEMGAASRELRTGRS
jgi:hypothetical protein